MVGIVLQVSIRWKLLRSVVRVSGGSESCGEYSMVPMDLWYDHGQREASQVAISMTADNPEVNRVLPSHEEGHMNLPGKRIQ